MKKRYRTFFLVILTAFILPEFSSAKDRPLIDPVQKETEQELKKQEEDKCGHLYMFKQMDCEKKVWRQFVEDGKIRGAEGYAEKQYGIVERVKRL